MQHDQKKTLEARLAALDSNERQKLYKRAAQLRKAEQSAPRMAPARRGRVTARESEGDADARNTARDRGAGRARSLDEWVLRILDQESPPTDALAPPDGGREGTVIWLGPAGCKLRDGDAVFDAILPRGRDALVVAVGDAVSYHKRDDAALVTAVRPRRTTLSRPDPHDARRERVIAANVDVVLVVVSVVAPPLHPRLIDRYLVAVQRGGAQAVVCVNKIDLLATPEARRETLALLEPYRPLGVPALPCSTATGEGLEDVRAWTRGRTCAFVGHSGVGKSSLANALYPEVGALTRDISAGYGRGRHTTTASTMYELPDGTRVIDTPGVRSFGLWDIELGALTEYFPEFDAHRGRCRFANCVHVAEPQCAVRAAAASGEIAPARYDTYLRLRASLAETP